MSGSKAGHAGCQSVPLIAPPVVLKILLSLLLRHPSALSARLSQWNCTLISPPWSDLARRNSLGMVSFLEKYLEARPWPTSRKGGKKLNFGPQIVGEAWARWPW